MFKNILLSGILLVFLATPIFSQQHMQDVVYLKNGSIIRGTITEQIPEVSLKIQTTAGNVFVYSMDKIIKTTKEPYKGIYSGKIKGKKSPGIAFALSLIIPGGGQYYNGDIFKGVIQDVLYIGGWVTYSVGLNYWEYDDLIPIGLGVVLGSSLWSIIDAPISAEKINERLEQQTYGHLFEFKHKKNVLGVDFGAAKDGFGAQLVYHF